MATITLHGAPFHTCGELPAEGTRAPDFRLTNTDLEDLTLADFSDRRKLLSIVPSMDTPTCALSTRKFDEHAKEHEAARYLTVSADLPFALQRFCTVENTDRVLALSMMRDRQFAADYGVRIEDGPLAGLCARAILVLDEQNRVVYRQLVTELTDEPDYESALRALRNRPATPRRSPAGGD